MDETYVKAYGQWVYLYRVVDKAGQTVDFFLSQNRDVNAAKSFLRSATKNARVPTKFTLDAYAASHRAVRSQNLLILTKSLSNGALRFPCCAVPCSSPGQTAADGGKTVGKNRLW
jgi:transposase-like protein